MKMNQRLLSRQILWSAMAVLLALTMILPAVAGKDRKRETARGNATVDIENFGQVNDHIYRGGQPKGGNYRQLAVLGVKTILDLRGDAEQDSKAESESAGLRYINLPMKPKRYPQGDTATRFLEIVNNQANWPVYVHCAGGRHRTGAMLAVYRMTMDQWTVDQAYNEMKKYDFYTSWGHGCYKDFVYDYYRDLSRQPSRLVKSASETVSGGPAQRNR
jgi:tyrosine-protein phosphatase SIW14